MNKTVALALFTLLLSVCLVNIPVVEESYGAVLLDRVVATINDEVITWSELRKVIEHDGEGVLKGVSEGEREKKRKNIEKIHLNRMVDMKLQIQEAGRLRIEVSDTEADSAVDEIKSKYNLTDETLRESLKKEGFTLEEYRKNLSDQILISKVVSMEVRPKVFVSESDIEKYYESNKEKYRDEEKVKIRQIFFSNTDDELMREALLTRAEGVVKRIREGEDFTKLAGEFSEDTNRDSGGDLGYIKRGSVLNEVEEAAFVLKPGEVSEPFWSTAGLHIIMVEDIVGGVAVEKIRGDIRNILFEESFRMKHNGWIKKLRESAYIEMKL